MPITALYRISSNEVVKISLLGQAFSDRDVAVWGVLTDPILTDGNQAVDATGNLRVLGTAKFAVVGSNTIRNATAPEITAFIAAQTADDNAADSVQATVMAQNHPMWRKVLKAVVKLVVNQLNTLRGQIIGVQTLVWDAPSMPNATGATSPNITVAGAAFGDFVEVACSASFGGLVAFGFVSAANTVQIRLHNGTGAAVNPGNLTYTVCVRRDAALAQITNQQGYNALAAEINPND